MLERADQIARIAELESDNARLRGLLDERNAPAELRHRLRSTIAFLRTIIRRTATTERDLESYVAHVEDRMDALMRAQGAAEERGNVNLHHLLSDELLHYEIAEGERALLSGPEIELRPRVGQVLALAVHELVINAVEYGSVCDAGGCIEVTWALSKQDQNQWITLEWKESGGILAREVGPAGFGTEVLRELLGYELEAKTELEFEEDGLRCTVRFPLTEKTGRVSDA